MLIAIAAVVLHVISFQPTLINFDAIKGFPHQDN